MLKRNKKGEYVIKTEKHAQTAIEELVKLREELKAPEIVQKEESVKQLTSAMTNFMINSGRKGFTVPTSNTLITLVEPKKKVIIATEDDMPSNAPDDLTPLQEVISKKAFLAVTKRIVDTEALSNAILEGKVTQKEVEQAYHETDSKPYARVTIKK